MAKHSLLVTGGAGDVRYGSILPEPVGVRRFVSVVPSFCDGLATELPTTEQAPTFSGERRHERGTREDVGGAPVCQGDIRPFVPQDHRAVKGARASS